MQYADSNVTEKYQRSVEDKKGRKEWRSVDQDLGSSGMANNRSPEGSGHPRLLDVLAKLYGGLYGRDISAKEEILTTVGAYLGLYYSFMAFVNHGDEVLIIDPAYDSYDPQVRMAGGTPVHYAMEVSQPAQSSSDFKIDISKLRAKCTKRTKMIVLNNPNNPTGKLYTREELEAIAEMVRDFNLIVVADEVYEWHRIHQNCVFTCSTPTQEALATAFEKE
ncbi:hypothetical protein TELCIR_00988 [Teladorsagia circumcincta]|uniref:kynurenine--oxoglutarate transaminase n=1 Tax=Teladorsagia circumcincta TaxID=45464 RepID=A0A2G9V379_TELCI|nr:hypothetical protein TELCIR_00988 [Teladorsagia circumcincta]